MSTPQMVMAKAMPNDIAATMRNVFTALLMPMLMWFSIMSATKFIIGTPGTMNKAQAISGCQGVSVCSSGTSQSGIIASTAGVEMNVESHASMVEKHAAAAMLTYPLEPRALSHALKRKPKMAARDA